MAIKFFKMEGTGNDFILLDDRKSQLNANDQVFWAKMADRHLGVGADGIIFLKKDAQGVFEMVYLNSDGHQVEMCGNGSRCFLQLIENLEGLAVGQEIKFKSYGALFRGQKDAQGLFHICLGLPSQVGKVPIQDLSQGAPALYAFTGVPHAVFEKTNIDKIDLRAFAGPIRHDKRFAEGVNVNIFEQISPGVVKMRTFERGVEDETLSCGTGAVATALAYQQFSKHQGAVTLQAPGGRLEVRFEAGQAWLSGPVGQVFEGIYL